MDKLIFTEHNEDCPAYTENWQCQLQVTYNRNVNDPQYGPCVEHLCPIFYWINLLPEEEDVL